MHINLILGNCIDSLMWYKKLKAEGKEIVVIVDYDVQEEMYYKNDILYISSHFAKEMVKEIRSIKYYKSLYIYPGSYKKLG